MIRSCKEGGKVLQMHLPANLSKSENFPRLWWEAHLKINPNQSLELWMDFFVRLIVKRFQRLRQFQFPTVDLDLGY